MTRYRRREADRRFYIDYFFIPEAWRTRVREVVAGEHDGWPQHNDHMPILADLAASFAPRSLD